MARYALLDMTNAVIREDDFEEQPGDPIGKGWHWVPIVHVTTPIPAADETLGPLISTLVDDQIIKERKIVQIDINRSDVNAERDRRLNKKYSVLINNTPVVVNMDTQSLNNLSNLAIQGLIFIARGDLVRTTTYRDANNTNHSLTADNLCDLFAAVNLQVQSLYEAAWLIKDDANLPDNLKELRNDIRWPV
jgi:hypothetical protein